MPCRKRKKLEEQEEREEELEEDSDVTEDDLDLPAEGDTHTPTPCQLTCTVQPVSLAFCTATCYFIFLQKELLTWSSILCPELCFLLCSANPGTHVENCGPTDAKNIVLVWLKVPS